jgi:hypothetical protein
MKLVTYNPENVPTHGKSQNPCLTIYNSGQIVLNKPLCEKIKFIASKKRKVSFHQDAEDARTWYISKDENGFELREIKDGTLSINRVSLVKTMQEAAGTDARIKCMVQPEPVEFAKQTYFRFILPKN